MATVYYYSQAGGDDDGTSEANAFTAIQTALNSLSAGDHLYCKRHTSREGAITTNITLTLDSNVNAGATVIEGYNTTPGDGGSGDGFYQTKSPCDMSGDGIVLKYFDINKETDGTTALRIRGPGSLAYRCIIKGTYDFGTVMDVQDSGAIDCYAIGKVTNATDSVFSLNRGFAINCTAEIESAAGSAGSAFRFSAAHRYNTLIGCLAINSDSDGSASHVGVAITGTNANRSMVVNTTIHNFSKGIEHEEGDSAMQTPNIYYGNIITSCGDGIVNSQASVTKSWGQYAVSNAFHSITSNQTSNMAAHLEPVTLTESPYIDTENYQLNNAPGGGSLLRGVLSNKDHGQTGDTRTNFKSYGGVSPNPNPEQSTTF